MKRAVLYARVSTADQIKGTSLEGQLSRARDYAKSKGYLVVAEDLDVISGRFIMARSTFNNFLEMMSAGQVDVMVGSFSAPGVLVTVASGAAS